MKGLTNGIIFAGFFMLFGIIYLYASQGVGIAPMRNSVAYAKRDPNDTTRTHNRSHSSGGVYIYHGGGSTIRGNGNNGTSGSGSFRSGSRSGRGK